MLSPPPPPAPNPGPSLVPPCHPTRRRRLLPKTIPGLRPETYCPTIVALLPLHREHIATCAIEPPSHTGVTASWKIKLTAAPDTKLLIGVVPVGWMEMDRANIRCVPTMPPRIPATPFLCARSWRAGLVCAKASRLACHFLVHLFLVRRLCARGSVFEHAGVRISLVLSLFLSPNKSTPHRRPFFFFDTTRALLCAAGPGA